MKKRHREEQIIRILRGAGLQAVPIPDPCKRHNVPERIFYRWRDKYGGMEVADARPLKTPTGRHGVWVDLPANTRSAAVSPNRHRGRCLGHFRQNGDFGVQTFGTKLATDRARVNSRPFATPATPATRATSQGRVVEAEHKQARGIRGHACSKPLL